MSAGNFGDEEGMCEECARKRGLTYTVKQKKILCKGCVPKREGLRWACEEHLDKEMELYCKKHDQPICHTCSRVSHKECDVVEIEKEADVKRERLLELKKLVKDKLTSWKWYGSKIGVCKRTANRRLHSLDQETKTFFNDELQRALTEEQRERDRINEEMEEEIRKAMEKGDARLKKCREDAAKRREPIKKKERTVQEKLEALSKSTKGKAEELHNNCEAALVIIAEADKKLNTVLESDRMTVEKAQELEQELEHNIFSLEHDESYVDRLTQKVIDLEFFPGGSGSNYESTFIGYGRQWELCDTVEIPGIAQPLVVGCIDESYVIVRQRQQSWDTHKIDLNRKLMSLAIRNEKSRRDFSCMAVNDELMMFSKWLGDCRVSELKACITLLNRKWTIVRNITIPKNARENNAYVKVDVSCDGMIYASELGQENVYIINPADGSITNTIKSEDRLRMYGVLSTGDVVARIADKIVVIDKNGKQRKIADVKGYLNCAIDKRTDDVFLLSWDSERKVCTVDMLLSSEDYLPAKDILSFSLAASPGSIKDDGEVRWCIQASNFVMLPSGKLLVCDGRNCLVFKKGEPKQKGTWL